MTLKNLTSMSLTFESQARTKMLKFRHIFITFTVIFDGILVPFALLYQINLRTYSPSTSCQRLGPCPSRSWWSWSLPALKNRPSVTSTWTRSKIETLINYQLMKIKFTLNKIWNWAGLTARRSDWSGRSRSSGHEIRPETHWLVKTEVSRLIRVV